MPSALTLHVKHGVGLVGDSAPKSARRSSFWGMDTGGQMNLGRNGRGRGRA